MTDQTAHQPLTDQQLDEIEACVNGPLGSATDFDHTTVAPLVAEVRRLRAELAAVTGLCDEQEMAARLFELPTPEWIPAVRSAIEQHPAPVAAVGSPADGTPESAR